MYSNQSVTSGALLNCSATTYQINFVVKEAIQKSIETNEGQIVRLTSDGVNAAGVIVSSFQFEWSLKVK